jgi:hypothetical protein
MKKLLLLVVLAYSVEAIAASCKTPFTVIAEDALGNLGQGLSSKDADWLQKKIASKYPEICYAGTSVNTDVVFFIRVTPATYNGTQTVHSTQTTTEPVNGTITDQNGNTATISGTEQTTSTTTAQVPYSVNYGVYTLWIQRRGVDGKFEVVHAFQQEGLYNTVTWYGVPIGGGGRGKHPEHAVIEDALKWIARGGLTTPSSSSVKPN